MASFGIRIIRSAFGVAEHVVPGLAGKVAFELFSRTPNPKALSDKERRALAQSERFMTGARRHRLTTKSGCVMAFDFRPEPGSPTFGTVLVLHGWQSRTEHMRLVIEAIRATGHRVISLDLPGHGQSTGRRLNIMLAVDAARVAGEWFGPFEAIVGHSFGGAVALNAAVGSIRGIPPLATKRLMLIAAPSSMPTLFEDFGRFLSLGPRAQTAVATQIERIAGRPLEDFVGATQLAEARIPTLVVHAPDDREVSADHARMFASAGDHVSVHWAGGFGHRRILGDPASLAQIGAFMTRPAEARALVH